MHNTRISRSLALPALVLALSTVAACGGAGASPTPAPTTIPTPTPVSAKVATPADAAALVIATNPMFAGAIQLTPDLIGASTYWESTPLATGGYTIVMTVGWGDCPAGCIERHVWTYDVAADGQLKLVSEVGDEVPQDLPA